ncbi:lipid asymmetry maintenance protein MlaB [Halopseudomonas pelagia]|uniref:Anti-sigma factor antagonist n=1 Tax=Halopseudomonas pelagia TaxID=553151 RepID=A0AA91Z5R4_9GAMM|nr:STAS domain-containing protein [Halopseudomonas pelagia]PCC99153.1 sulfate transporter [Halopseudomonas pelagia]QFY55896.1 anti-sigma factor antagonist [Halopseudomonas pelagia]
MSAQVTRGEQGVIALAGQLNFDSAMDVRKQLQQNLADTQGDITLDLSGVEHSNSVGLALILLVARIVSERGDQLRVVSMPAGLESIARVCELDDWLTTLAA